jgi:hypothetical protein
VDALDLRFFATAVILQRETGGNLADVLGNTASLIRERFRVLGDIRTLTAQGKLTGAILVALPLVMGLGMYLLAPDYFQPMLSDPSGRATLITAAVMQLLRGLVLLAHRHHQGVNHEPHDRRIPVRHRHRSRGLRAVVGARLRTRSRVLASASHPRIP